MKVLFIALSLLSLFLVACPAHATGTAMQTQETGPSVPLENVPSLRGHDHRELLSCAGKWCSYQYKQYHRGSCKKRNWIGICKEHNWNYASDSRCKQLWGSTPLSSYGPSSTVRFRRESGTGKNEKCKDRDDIGNSGCNWKEETWGDLFFGWQLLAIWYCS